MDTWGASLRDSQVALWSDAHSQEHRDPHLYYTAKAPKLEARLVSQRRRAVAADEDHRMVTACQKPPCERTAEDLQYMQVFLCFLSTFFALWPTQLQREMCRMVTAHILAKHEVLLTRGKAPDRLYFILNGRVAITVPRPPEDGGDANGNSTHATTCLGRGNTVGEGAVLAAPMCYATVSVASPTAVLLSLTHTDIMRAFKEVLGARAQNRIGYLTVHPLFSSLSEADVQALSSHLQLSIHPPGTQLWSTNEPGKLLFFLAEGHCCVRRIGSLLHAGNFGGDSSSGAAPETLTGQPLTHRDTISVLGPYDIFGLPPGCTLDGHGGAHTAHGSTARGRGSLAALRARQTIILRDCNPAQTAQALAASVLEVSSAVMSAVPTPRDVEDTGLQGDASHRSTGRCGSTGGAASISHRSDSPGRACSAGGIATAAPDTSAMPHVPTIAAAAAAEAWAAGGSGGVDLAAASPMVIESQTQVKLYHVSHVDFHNLPRAVRQVILAADAFKRSYLLGRLEGLQALDASRAARQNDAASTFLAAHLPTNSGSKAGSTGSPASAGAPAADGDHAGIAHAGGGYSSNSMCAAGPACAVPPGQQQARPQQQRQQQQQLRRRGDSLGNPGLPRMLAERVAETLTSEYDAAHKASDGLLTLKQSSRTPCVHISPHPALGRASAGTGSFINDGGYLLHASRPRMDAAAIAQQSPDARAVPRVLTFRNHHITSEAPRTQSVPANPRQRHLAIFHAAQQSGNGRQASATESEEEDELAVSLGQLSCRSGSQQSSRRPGVEHWSRSARMQSQNADMLLKAPLWAVHESCGGGGDAAAASSASCHPAKVDPADQLMASLTSSWLPKQPSQQAQAGVQPSATNGAHQKLASSTTIGAGAGSSSLQDDLNITFRRGVDRGRGGDAAVASPVKVSERGVSYHAAGSTRQSTPPAGQQRRASNAAAGGTRISAVAAEDKGALRQRQQPQGGGQQQIAPRQPSPPQLRLPASVVLGYESLDPFQWATVMSMAGPKAAPAAIGGQHHSQDSVLPASRW